MKQNGKQCNDVRALFLDSFHGHLPKDRQEFIERHLGGCRECRDEFNRQIEIFEALDAGRPAPKLADDFWDGYWDRLQEKAAKSPGRANPTSSSGFLTSRIWFSAAAILLVVLGVVAGRYWFPATVHLPAPQTASSDSIYPVVQQHFEALSPILLDYSNQEVQDGMNDTEILRTLLLQNRLLKRMASRAQNPALIELLEDLEIVIIEMLNRNGEAGDTAGGVGRLSQDNDLLFKMKIYKRKAQNLRQMPI